MRAKMSSRIYFNRVVVMSALLIPAIAGSHYWCSCYTFYDDSHGWSKSRNLCQASGGDIVSIETLQEWKIINKQIKTRTTKTGANQWWVGLQLKEGTWLWLSNSSMSYNKWKKQHISGRYSHKYSIAVIDKVDGTFLKTKLSVESGTICESSGKGCSSNQTSWCRTGSHPTKSTLTVTTEETRPTVVLSVTEAQTPTVNYNVSNYDSVLQVSSTTNTQEKGGRSFRPQKKAFPFHVLVVVLAVILLVCVGILIVVWICKSKKKGGHNLMKRRKTSVVKLEMALDVQYMYDQYPEEGNSTSSHKIVNVNDCVQSTQQIDTAATQYRDTKVNTIEKNGNVIHENTRNTMEEEFENTGQQNKNIGEEEKDESNEKTNDESKVVFTTFITKIEEEEEEEEEDDEDVFYSEETQQKNNPGNLLTHENSSDMFTYATIDETEDKGSNEALYAEVNDIDTNENDEQAVTYAEIVEFSANSKDPIKKPTPYYPTEYASVTVHPLSPRFSEY